MTDKKAMKLYLPDETHKEIRRRAKAAAMSMSVYTRFLVIQALKEPGIKIQGE